MSESGQQTVLITGATRGIGIELAMEFACHGHSLLLTARNESQLLMIAAELRQQHGVEVHAIPADLALPGAASDLFERIRTLGVDVDLLINNAGIVSYGRFAETAVEHELQLIQLNMVSLTHLTKLFLKPMLERGHGRIVNVASVGGHQPGGPMWAVYFASKAYVLSFSKALSIELKGSGISVTAPRSPDFWILRG